MFGKYAGEKSNEIKVERNSIMLVESMRVEKCTGVCLVVDFGECTVQGYAMAWLKLCNAARENKDAFYSVKNNGKDNIVEVVVNPEDESWIVNFVTEIYGETVDGVYNPIGAVVGRKEVKVGTLLYDCSSTLKNFDDACVELEGQIEYWRGVQETFD